MSKLDGLFAIVCFALLGCASPAELPELEPGEQLPGGAATHTQPIGKDAFDQPAPSLSSREARAFANGRDFFVRSWVQAPSSPDERDGVGPTFNARACSGCHFRSGRGTPSDDDPTAVGLLLRLSITGSDEHRGPLGDPSYGDQLQDRSLPDIPVEGRFTIELELLEGEYADGERYTLRAPRYRFEQLAFGELAEGVFVSPRLAPQLIGTGLLEAVTDARIEALADPDDDDGDGISGRVNRVWDLEVQALAIGRLGWKAEQPSVRQQVAAAFLSDLGVTSSLFPEQNCPASQRACAEAADGGDPEVADSVLEDVALYTRTLAVPARRSADDPIVLRGKALFREAGCDGCHVPSHETGRSPIAVLSEQMIWPYTDLLLHDMGQALSDDRPVFDAQGREWLTPPLWGLGLLQEVNGHERLLHDGRARDVAEAILWHGGEAEAAKESFRVMAKQDRDALVRFVRSL